MDSSRGRGGKMKLDELLTAILANVISELLARAIERALDSRHHPKHLK